MLHNEAATTEKLRDAFDALVASAAKPVDCSKFRPPGRVTYSVCCLLTPVEVGKLVQLGVWSFHARETKKTTPRLWGLLATLGPALVFIHQQWQQHKARGGSLTRQEFASQTYGVNGISTKMWGNYVRFYHVFELCPIMATVDMIKSEMENLLFSLYPKVAQWVEDNSKPYHKVPELDLATMRTELARPLPEPKRKPSRPPKKRRLVDVVFTPPSQVSAAARPPPPAATQQWMPERPPMPPSVNERMPTPGDLLPGPRPTALKASAFNMPR
jgi:hypothetical protein